jgi:beta-N-acetylhexosaminidase
LMPTALAPTWDELQSEAQYQHAKGLLQQLKLIR